MPKEIMPNPEKPVTILIVEDQIDFLKELEDILLKKEYRIDSVRTIKDAETKLKQSKISVMLLSIDSDSSKGLKLIDKLKRLSPRTLCIVMSNNFSAELALESLQKGAYDFIRKPFDMGQLLSSLDRCIDKIKLEKEKASFELALLEAEERYRMLVETMNDGLSILDKNGAIVYANDSLCKILHYSNDELVGKNVFILFDDVNQQLFQKKLEQLKRGSPSAFEITMKGKNKEDIPSIFSTQRIEDSDGNYDGSFAVITDITEQIQSKEKIRESEVKYRGLFEDSLDAIVIMDRNGNFMDVNRAAYELLGYTKEGLVKIPFQQIYENIDALLAFQHEIDDNGYVKEHAARIRKNDGALLDCLISANSHKGKDGAIIGYQAIIRDITEKKRLETQIHRAQKMDSIGTLASGITHDFNNLLMGMRGKVSLMLFKIDSNHPHYEKLKTIEQLIDSATGLTKQLLDFARGGQFVMKTADVNEIIKTSSNMFGRTNKAINIHKKYQKYAWAVNVDQGQIEQVLLNMYVNSAQAMPAGGDIYISSENVVLHENFVKPFQIKPGKYVKISVQDNGIGMDEKMMQRVFDPFFTTKKAEKGSGLGLSMAYGIIKKHGGIIDVSSEKGSGTTFDIYLKVSEKPIKKIKKISQSVLTGNESILVIDDEEVIIDHIKEMLETLGYRVLWSLKGKEALEIYKNNISDIGIVILDMIMPEMSGSDVYQHLMDINPNVKILLASGYTADDKVLEILKNEHCGFIQKPFDIVHLSHKVREIIDSPVK